MRKVPEAATPIPSSPFTRFSSPPNPKLRVKVVARAKDHRLGHPHFVTLNKSPAFRTCLHGCTGLIDRMPEAPRIPMLGRQEEAGGEFEVSLTLSEKQTDNNEN